MANLIKIKANSKCRFKKKKEHDNVMNCSGDPDGSLVMMYHQGWISISVQKHQKDSSTISLMGRDWSMQGSKVKKIWPIRWVIAGWLFFMRPKLDGGLGESVGHSWEVGLQLPSRNGRNYSHTFMIADWRVTHAQPHINTTVQVWFQGHTHIHTLIKTWQAHTL